MSILNIRYYDQLAVAGTGRQMPLGRETPYTSGQDVDFTGSEQLSTVFPDNTQLVRLVATVDARVEFGDDPVVDDNASLLLPAGQVEYFGVMSGMKLAVKEAI